MAAACAADLEFDDWRTGQSCPNFEFNTPAFDYNGITRQWKR